MEAAVRWYQSVEGNLDDIPADIAVVGLVALAADIAAAVAALAAVHGAAPA